MLQEIKQTQDDFQARGKRSKKSKLYTCSYCGYDSTRLFNVQRHERRIHSKRKLQICCGQKLLSKGDYYIHCEKHHPESRPSAVTSRGKYKISSCSVALNEEARQLCQWELNRRFSERILMKKEEKMKSQVSLSYKVTYSDLDMENIPLIYFLTDHQLKPHMKRLSSSGINKTDEISDNDENSDTQTAEIAISSEQDIEKQASENDGQELRDSIDLPTKKLILHRFRTSATRKFGIPLMEQNNNDPDQANIAEATATESVSLMKNYGCRSKNLEWEADKENLSTFALSFKQQIDIVLDRGITVPVVTQLQREFLGSFNFDQYRIL